MGRPMKIKPGDVFGKLTVVSYSHCSDSGAYVWNVRCECGKEKTVFAANLSSGQSTSCGCSRRKRTRGPADATDKPPTRRERTMANFLARQAKKAEQERKIAEERQAEEAKAFEQARRMIKARDAEEAKIAKEDRVEYVTRKINEEIDSRIEGETLQEWETRLSRDLYYVRKILREEKRKKALQALEEYRARGTG